MRISNSIILITLILFSCSQPDKKKTELQAEQYAELADSSKVETLPALLESVLSLSERDFNEVIELHGTSHPVDKIFKVSGCEMIALDTILIVKNKNDNKMFMAFSLPDFKFIKSFGRNGRGPGEFQFPRLVKDESGEFLCFIFEQANDKLYSLNSDYEISELPVVLQKGEKRFSDKQLCGFSANDFVYVESVKMGKAIFRIISENDSANTTLLKNLAFSEKHKNWAAYIGDFGASRKNKRLVYAYKYFKRIIFFDLENKTSKVISFDVPSKTGRGSAASMMSPSNITHYWGMSVNDKYVYVLYSGRSPIDVTKELKKSSGYIYVEKFDWNGNPISKYKLDNWGYFCVNAKGNTIYLASTTDESPFISYKLTDK
jgi:hypothetical protein